MPKIKKPLYKQWWLYVIVVILLIGLIAGNNSNNSDTANVQQDITASVAAEEQTQNTQQAEASEPTAEPNQKLEQTVAPTTTQKQEPAQAQETAGTSIFEGYRLIEVDGGDLSGHREPNVVVDIGFGDREYWAFTNEYGQLVKVIAKRIILQDDSKEPVTSDGRYYPDEAKVPGTERPDLDEGHVIADSLGGVSNAYNITPQNSVLNRHGDQAYMEKVIRDAGGCTDFEAIITYPNTETQIPSRYKYTYTINGNVIVDEFDNVNPDEVNAQIIKEATAQDALTEYKYVGSSKSDKYHLPTCRYAKEIKTDNLLKFKDKEAAEAAGYVPCGVCKP